ncbi:MAG TPA: heavy metal-responsive transcriptional regulator [Chthoniobacterales bacterium]|nr:heavy metal-responsive transcriptional regulator [Chthoniobacterales bacterium]
MKSSHVGISTKLLTDESELRIGAIANRAGVGVQTLHYYERVGLLPKPARSASNYRLYSFEALRRVQFIKKAQAVGFTLEEIRQILDLKSHGRAPCRKVAELGEKHLREIDDRLADLRRYRNAVAQSLASWREKTAHRRNCAGEFCDLIERLP